MMRPRAEWGKLLAAADPGSVSELAAQIGQRADVSYHQVPQEGHKLLIVEDSALFTDFSLGEVPLCRVHVKLDDGQTTAEGGAALMSDDIQRVRSIAILDAALAANWPEAADIEPLLESGLARLNSLEATRSHALERTRVNFSRLSEE